MRQYQPAIYICARCGVEHHGDAGTLPIGWRHSCDIDDCDDCIQCGDCCLFGPRPIDDANNIMIARPTPSITLGILAARFSGVLVRASDLPRAEPRQ